MANKNKRTKARREKETKEAQHKKVVEKPIYKRPWIWIALAALVIAIVVPSAYQYYQQLQDEKAAAAAEAEAKEALEPDIWASVLTPLAEIGVEESAVTDKSFDIVASEEGGEYNYATITVTTDVRTLVAAATYYRFETGDDDSASAAALESASGSWMCMQITNEDGSHIYWTVSNQGVENATQAAVYAEDGTQTYQPLYDYETDEPVPGSTTGAAVETAPETTGGAVTDEEAAPEATGEAVTDAPAEDTTAPAADTSEEEAAE
ncbi:MAG: hypothetical protein LBJ91_07900 [Clostridiales Family XIII bacterium]|jgi:hypothetical protein|nr:hypothetical protein [Clostridiales Family XIII bacterium]